MPSTAWLQHVPAIHGPGAGEGPHLVLTPPRPAWRDGAERARRGHAGLEAAVSPVPTAPVVRTRPTPRRWS